MTSAQSQPAVFLDRDGVINANIWRDGKPFAPTNLADFQLLRGVADAIRSLKGAGFLVIVMTNQPDVRNGITPRETVEAMHAELRRGLLIDDIKVCFHNDADNCSCRKPKPGMILEAAEERNIDLSRSYVIGDRWRDTLAGRAAGCFSFFVDYDHAQERPHQADQVVRSLNEAVDAILAREEYRRP